MKYTLIVIIGILLLGSGVFYFTKDPKREEGVPVLTEGTPSDSRAYTNDEYGISFLYPKSYLLREREAGTAERPQKAIVLVEDTQENRDLLDGKMTEPREGPISITIDLYPNPERLSAEEWVANDTNWVISDKVLTKTSVGGKEGVSFNWDGLYPGRSTVVTFEDTAAVFSMTWLTPLDQILKHAESIFGSVRFH